MYAVHTVHAVRCFVTPPFYLLTSLLDLLLCLRNAKLLAMKTMMIVMIAEHSTDDNRDDVNAVVAS